MAMAMAIHGHGHSKAGLWRALVDHGFQLLLLFLLCVCDQVSQVVPVQEVDHIDEVHQLDPVHQGDHKDELATTADPRTCLAA